MILRLSIFLVVISNLIAQGDQVAKAEFHYEQGNKLFDSGLYEDALIQYQMAKENDPGEIKYPYSEALTYYQQQEYPQAVKILDSLSKLDNAFVQIFQLLGNSQDFLGKNEQAIQSYIRGLDKFPNSGRLYMEIGLVELNQSDTIKALGFWEQALKVEPDFTHMYYRLTKFYDLVDDDLLTIFYGEIYLNLTTNIEYFREINKLVYDTYNEILTIGDDGKFFADIGMYYRPTIDSEYLTYFSARTINIMVEAYFRSLDENKEKLSIADIIKVKRKFLELWFNSSYAEKYPNPLFDLQKKILDEGKFVVYNYWLLSEGNYDEFKEWIQKNGNEFQAFISWLGTNRLSFDGYDNYTGFFYSRN